MPLPGYVNSFLIIPHKICIMYTKSINNITNIRRKHYTYTDTYYIPVRDPPHRSAIGQLFMHITNINK